jgi:hydroxyacylglutathione hydrolase
MKIEQFEDKGLSHYSYAVLSEFASEIILIDPARNIDPYLAYADKYNARIVGVIETHPHADFISGHLELHKVTGAAIYCSRRVCALYPHKMFDDKDVITFGEVRLKALNTPGHSPDSICIILEQDEVDKAVFTGDTLFVGDCGRPDLRENAGNEFSGRKELAKLLYYSLRDQLMKLDDNVLVYPAHGAGTLCGKALSEANCSTIGAEKFSNWSLQQLEEHRFVDELLRDQPFIPKYFPYDVQLNKTGAENLSSAVSKVACGMPDIMNDDILIIDTRAERLFKQGHLPNSVNLQKGGKFETWLGSIIAPEEAFYLTAGDRGALETVIKLCAKIGYEKFIKQAFIFREGDEKMKILSVEKFNRQQRNYTIIDVRNEEEVKEHPIFEQAISIPLPQLRERAMDIPFDKPIVVHCAGGYRSAAGSSIIQYAVRNKTTVYDLGEAVKQF